MKSYLSTALFLSGILIIGTQFSCNSKKDQKGTVNQKAVSENLSVHSGVRIAFVNLDTLEEKYTYFKEQKNAFAQRQASIEAQLNSGAQQLQNEYIAFQKKAQAGGFTQAEGEAAQQKLARLQQDLETKRDNLSSALLKDQDSFNKQLKKTLDSFLAVYNKDQKYDFILSQMEGSGLLVANPAYDITNDVVNGLNKSRKAQSDKK